MSTFMAFLAIGSAPWRWPRPSVWVHPSAPVSGSGPGHQDHLPGRSLPGKGLPRDPSPLQARRQLQGHGRQSKHAQSFQPLLAYLIHYVLVKPVMPLAAQLGSLSFLRKHLIERPNNIHDYELLGKKYISGPCRIRTHDLLSVTWWQV